MRNKTWEKDRVTTPMRKLITKLPGRQMSSTFSRYFVRYAYFSRTVLRLGCYLLCNLVMLYCNHFVPGSAEVADMVFNLCVKENGCRRDDADYEITLDYEFLEDIYSDWSENGDGAASETSSQMNFSMDDSPEVDGCKRIHGKAAVEKAVQHLERKENHPIMIMVNPS